MFKKMSAVMGDTLAADRPGKMKVETIMRRDYGEDSCSSRRVASRWVSTAVLNMELM